MNKARLYIIANSILILAAICIFSQFAIAGSVTLSWTPPTTNEDGTRLTDLAGYKIYYGTASGNYTQNVNAGNVTTYTVTNLSDGLTYYFAVTSYDTSNNESRYSNEVSKSLAATQQQYTLSVTKAGTGTGSVTSTPAGISCGSDCAESYNSGTVVTLTASADTTSSTFTGWTGACSGTGSCSVTMSAARSVTATFTLKTYTITASAGTGGSISPSGSVSVSHGANQTFTITPNTGYGISDVMMDGLMVGAVSSYTFRNVTAPHTISASFSQQQRQTLTVAKSGSGSGTVTSSPAGISCGSDCSEPYNSGTTVTLTATPDANSTFTGWSGACSGTGSCSVTMSTARSVTATFALKTYIITASAGTGGSISPSGSVSVNHGANQTFTITASSGYSIADVTVNGSSVGAVGSYIFTNVTAANTINASFTQLQYTLTVTKAGTGSGTVSSSPAGISCGSDCSEPYNSGTTVTLTATPDANSTFTGWSGACSGTGSCSVTMNASKNIMAYFTTTNNKGVPQNSHIPITGQHISYASGDDGSIRAGIEWPNPRFIDNRDGTITDTLTGLMWLKDGGCLRNTWSSAMQTVADLNANPGKYGCLDYSAKHTDWRVPNIRELQSLINFGESNNASWLNYSGFRNVKSSSYWSSTAMTNATSLYQFDYFWAINMSNGTDATVLRSNSLYLLPVRTTSAAKPYDVPRTGQTSSIRLGDDGSIQAGAEWPNPRFIDNRDGTITDALTGLMWLKDARCLRKTWNRAMQTVADMNANPGKYACQQYSARYTDWRLPNVRELQSLVNFGEANNASWLNYSGFLITMDSSYWSSTTLRSSRSTAWILNMQKGNLASSMKFYRNYLLPVRGGL